MSVTNVDHFSDRFNPLTHQAPKYDIFGRIKKVQFHPHADRRNILGEKEQIKVPWKGKNENDTFPAEPLTRTSLLETRKREKVPDISYDLDRDGFVGGRDYVLAKRFDRDGDGKLNEQEKKEAYDAIRNHIEDVYVWNLDNQGPNREYRILQKRGKIIDGEDFLPLRDTFPVHPISARKPQFCTTSELQDRRKLMTKRDIDEKIKIWEHANPSVILHEPKKDTFNNKPEFTSIKQKKEIAHRAARINCGLKEVEDDVKNPQNLPGLNYVYEPKHTTVKDIKRDIRKENIEQSKRLAHTDHKDEIARLNEREDEVFEKLYTNNEERLTINKIKEKRKKENLEYNIRTFSNQTIGVHGHELPKFSENEEVKEYWKLKDGYKENPANASLAVYKENLKYWKKPEELILLEHQENIPSPDAFSKVKVPLVKKEELVIKVNNLNHFKNKGFDPDNPRPINIDDAQRKHIYKWTTLVNQFAPQKFKQGRFFDSLPSVGGNGNDDKAMYSSFSDNGIFESTYMKMTGNKVREDKYVKVNENERNNMDYVGNQFKDNLFQKFSNKEGLCNNRSTERPKVFTIRTKGL